jgi:hypothetical protein
MRYLTIFLCAACLVLSAQVRKEINIPDIPGYKTLKCDFHMHTVFSDGQVWPKLRAIEAWQQGLDAISITDHIEYHRHEEDIPVTFNRTYEIARPFAESHGLILIKGAEITRGEPMGHFNAIFLKDVKPLNITDSIKALELAFKQGAFIFRNHPQWKEKPGVPVWQAVHDTILKNGWMHGVEVVNGHHLQDKVHAWCIQKKLALMGNSDVHGMIYMHYDLCEGDHRPVTLVFAKQRTAESIKKALFDRRTAVYWADSLIGDEKYLAAIFKQSVEVVDPAVTIKLKGKRPAGLLQIRNKSEVTFELVNGKAGSSINIPVETDLRADRITTLRIRPSEGQGQGNKKITLKYNVKNLAVAPDRALPVEFKITCKFEGSPDSK